MYQDHYWRRDWTKQRFRANTWHLRSNWGRQNENSNGWEQGTGKHLPGGWSDVKLEKMVFHFLCSELCVLGPSVQFFLYHQRNISEIFEMFNSSLLDRILAWHHCLIYLCICICVCICICICICVFYDNIGGKAITAYHRSLFNSPRPNISLGSTISRKNSSQIFKQTNISNVSLTQ